MKTLPNNHLTQRTNVALPKITQLGDFFTFTPQKREGVTQERFDQMQQQFSDFIESARSAGYKVRCATKEDCIPPLSVVFERGKRMAIEHRDKEKAKSIRKNGSNTLFGAIKSLRPQI